MMTAHVPSPAPDDALPVVRRAVISPPPPYSLARTATALARFPRLLNRWDGTTYRRLFRLHDAFVAVAVQQMGSDVAPILALTMRSPAAVPAATLDTVQQIVSQMLGTTEDIRPFMARAEQDDLLAPIVRRLPGLRLFRKSGVTEEVVVDILAQQISLPFAYQTKARLVAAFGPRIVVHGATLFALPEPAILATLTPDMVRPLLISRQKAAAMRAFGEAVVSGTLLLDALPAMTDADATAVLTAVRGVGPWTAHWTLGRTLARGHIVPVGDVGVQAMLGKLAGLGRKMTPAEVRQWADAWGDDAMTALAYVIVGAWTPEDAGVSNE